MSRAFTSGWMTARLRRLIAAATSLLFAAALTGCDWDEVTQKYLQQAKQLVESYPAIGSEICQRIPDAASRSACLAKVQADHAQMTKVLLQAILAATSCDEVIFKQAMETLRELAKGAANLGLNAVAPLSMKTPVQMQMQALSTDGVHYALAPEAFAWVKDPSGTTEGIFVGIEGTFAVAFSPVEGGLAGVVTSAELVALLNGFEVPVHLAAGAPGHPSALFLTAASPGSSKLAGAMHLQLDVQAPVLGAFTLALRLPVTTTDPSASLSLGTAGQAMPAEALMPSLVGLSSLTADCDKDGVADWKAIAAGASPDCNYDWIPDSCQLGAPLVCLPGLDSPIDECTFADCASHSCGPTRGDLNADGSVNVADVQCGVLTVLSLLSGSAVPPSCLAQAGAAIDLNCDGKLNILEVTLIISHSLGAPLPKAIDANSNGCPDACDPLSCDDGDACTLDGFDAALGCLHTPVSCDTGELCTATACVPELGCVQAELTSCSASPSCTVPSVGVGCGGGACEACVCGVDPFCCETQWDALCAQEAGGICAESCTGEASPVEAQQVVDAILGTVASGELPVALDGPSLAGGWAMKLASGLIVARSDLDAQAQPIVALGDAAVDPLLPWLYAESVPARYIAIHSLGQLLGAPLPLSAFDIPGFNDEGPVVAAILEGFVPGWFPKIPLGKCCVEHMHTTWSPSTGLYPGQMMRLDVEVDFGAAFPCMPACCAYEQYVSTTTTFTEPGQPAVTLSTAPLHDDHYSRGDDSDGNPALAHAHFSTNDNPGIRDLAAGSTVDYSFTARQRVLDACNGNAVVHTIGPHTATVTGIYPGGLTTTGLNISWIK